MERVVFVNQSVRVEPINIVEGDTLTAIDIYFADLTLDSNHSVKARNLRPDSVVKAFRSTSKNTTSNYIRLYASADTFAEGKNEIQIKLYTTGNSKRTYTFIIPVVCHKNICGGD